MAQPPPYDRQFNFQNQQLLTPADPPPADEMDAEYNAIKLTLDATLANLGLIQRDDGQLANESVGEDQLKPEIALLGHSLAEILVAAAEIEADRLAAEAAKNAAQASQNAAEAAKAAAQTSEANAATAEANAETAETNAETAETNAELAEVNAELAETNAEAAQAAAQAAQAAAEAAAARLVGTSLTTVTIGLGAKSFTTQGDRYFDAGTWLLIVSDANPAVNWMSGVSTSYVAGALTVDVRKIGGAGTLSDWTIRVSGVIGVDGATGAGTGDVLAAANFANDERLIRSDGTAKGVQASAAALTDAGALSGLTTIGMGGALSGATTISMSGALSGATTIGMGGALSGATTIGMSGALTVGTTAATAPIIDPSGFVQLPEIAAPATPASGFVRVYAKSDNKLYQKDDAGAETDLAAAGGGGSAGNLLINGGLQINQRAAATNADDTYCFDRWNVLTQTNTIAASALTDIENTTPFGMRLTQSQASAQRFGVEQILESVDSRAARGQSVALSARVRMSATTTLRFAILEWTGTVDTVTSDVVNDWTSATFTAGNFFLAASLTVAATGSAALTANTLASVSLTATIGSTCNNLIVLFWTDSTQAQNVTLDLAKVKFEIGAAATAFVHSSNADVLARCLRYYQRIIVTPTGRALTATIVSVPILAITIMRVAPTAAISGTIRFNDLNLAGFRTATTPSLSGGTFFPNGGLLGVDAASWSPGNYTVGNLAYLFCDAGAVTLSAEM